MHQVSVNVAVSLQFNRKRSAIDLPNDIVANLELPSSRYTGHYFLTTLLYSILLGFLGMDRFCLGHTGTAVGKLLTLGGVGIWWIVDIILLVTGNLTPEDGSSFITQH